MSTESNETLKTPLYAAHKLQKAKMIPFGDWIMPVSYESVLAEHKTVREACGIFDVSHMGEVRVTGIEALKFLQEITINDVSKLEIGGGQYTAILNEKGGMIDDLIIYRLASNEFFICVNASNRKKDFDWIQSQSKNYNVQVKDESSHWAQIAVQGPKTKQVLLDVLSEDAKHAVLSLPYTNIAPIKIFGEPSLLARTGYTGEFGFEIYVPHEIAERLWMALLELGAKHGLKPIGLGARDTLRLESCYLLYGNDMNESVSPLEAGISWATKLNKDTFIGKRALEDQKSSGLKRHMIAFKMIDEGIPRHDMPVFINGENAGKVTSGSVLPTIGGAGGMALVSTQIKVGDEFNVDIRGTKKRAIAVKRPLYNAQTK